jgi:hypothetical protein
MPRERFEPWFDDVDPGLTRPKASPREQFPLLGSVAKMPDIRARLHTICALYSHAPNLEHRIALLDTLENLALQTAQILAVELLECGWRPDAGLTDPDGGPQPRRSHGPL